VFLCNFRLKHFFLFFSATFVWNIFLFFSSTFVWNIFFIPRIIWTRHQKYTIWYDIFINCSWVATRWQ
jgi:hypothetical protein